MTKFIDFKNIHTNDSAIICGLGNSLNDLTHRNIRNNILIGVNDVQRTGIIPDYLVFLDKISDLSKRKFDKENNRQKYITNFKSKFLFLHSYNDNLKYFDDSLHERIIIAKAVRFNGLETKYNPDYYYHTIHSPFAAVTLAIYMGFKRIGIIGVDFSGSHAFGQSNPSNSLWKRINTANHDFVCLKNLNPDITFVNLSLKSKISAFKKINPDCF